MKVLITDGNFKHTLAAVRSLGKKGMDVTVLSDHRLSVSFYSKYCSHRIIAPNPEYSGDFSSTVRDLVKKGNYDVLLPISYAAVDQISNIQDVIRSDVRVPLPDRSSVEIAGNKDKTMQLAESIDVPIPKTYYPETESDIAEIADLIIYPAVVKGTRENGNVGYANSSKELVEQYKKISEYSPVVQEYITGEGYGFFALYNHGEARAIFMHRRLREYPVTGGPSALAESVYDPTLMEQGLKLLDSLNWHGVAMVEFKKDEKTGNFVLMEINPKFWGSLELAIASGVDFPYLTCKMACDGDIEPVFDYKRGVKFRWLFPQDIFHAITTPRAISRFVSDFADTNIRYDIDPHDLKPNVLQVGMTAAEFALRIKERRFWRPHGRPQF
ncbi:MAG: ATP-grasp domain-containing protein [Methanomicrobiales archaeon]